MFSSASAVFESSQSAIICSVLIWVKLLFEQEKSVLNTLEFNMSVPTPYVFMRRFLKAADSDKQVKYHNILSSD